MTLTDAKALCESGYMPVSDYLSLSGGGSTVGLENPVHIPAAASRTPSEPVPNDRLRTIPPSLCWHLPSC